MIIRMLDGKKLILWDSLQEFVIPIWINSSYKPAGLNVFLGLYLQLSLYVLTWKTGETANLQACLSLHCSHM